MEYQILGNEKSKLNAHQKLLVGALSGTVSVIFTYPLDFARGKIGKYVESTYFVI